MERRRRIQVRILRWLGIILAGAAVGVAYILLSVLAWGCVNFGVFVANLGAPVFWVALISVAGLPWLVLWPLATFLSPARAAVDGALVGCVVAAAIWLFDVPGADAAPLVLLVPLGFVVGWAAGTVGALCVLPPAPSTGAPDVQGKADRPLRLERWRAMALGLGVAALAGWITFGVLDVLLLIQSMRVGTLSQYAICALKSRGDRAEVGGMLDDVQHCLSRMGPAARDALPALLALLNHQDTRLRSAAIGSIGVIAAGDKGTGQQLLPTLNDPDPAVRRVADDFLRDIRVHMRREP
jgi:hypothetical protein